MQTKRFEFPGGDYWEVYTEKTWGAQRAVERLSKTFLKLDGAAVDAATGNLTGEITLDPEKWDPAAANEVLLLHSTVAWSYGPITPETIAKVSIGHVQQVLDYINEVYPEGDPLVDGRPAKEQGNNSSWPSLNKTAPSQKK